MADCGRVLCLLLAFAFCFLSRQFGQMLLVADTSKVEDLKSSRQVIVILVILFAAFSFLGAESASVLRLAEPPLPRRRPNHQSSRHP